VNTGDNPEVPCEHKSLKDRIESHPFVSVTLVAALLCGAVIWFYESIRLPALVQGLETAQRSAETLAERANELEGKLTSANDTVADLKTRVRTVDISFELSRERLQASENDLRIQRTENNRLVELLAEKNTSISELRGRLASLEPEAAKQIPGVLDNVELSQRIAFLRDHLRQNIYRVNQDHLVIWSHVTSLFLNKQKVDNTLHIDDFLRSFVQFMGHALNARTATQVEVYNEMLRRFESSGQLTRDDFMASVRQPVEVVAHFEKLREQISAVPSNAVSLTDWFAEKTKTVEDFYSLLDSKAVLGSLNDAGGGESGSR
jgi:hypothetical protein